MTNAKSNYGTRLKVGAGYTVDVGEVVSIDPPEIIAEAAEATSQSSAGWREHVPSGLKELSEFSVTINFTDTYAAAIMSDLTTPTVESYQIQFPDDGATKWAFSAIVTSFKPLSADAASPESLQAEVKFQPTGALVVS